jgi:hypothetical protein
VLEQSVTVCTAVLHQKENRAHEALSMDIEIAGKITKLPDMGKTELRSIWQTSFDQPAPSHLRKN